MRPNKLTSWTRNGWLLDSSSRLSDSCRMRSWKPVASWLFWTLLTWISMGCSNTQSRKKYKSKWRRKQTTRATKRPGIRISHRRRRSNKTTKLCTWKWRWSSRWGEERRRESRYPALLPESRRSKKAYSMSFDILTVALLSIFQLIIILWWKYSTGICKGLYLPHYSANWVQLLRSLVASNDLIDFGHVVTMSLLHCFKTEGDWLDPYQYWFHSLLRVVFTIRAFRVCNYLWVDPLNLRISLF